MIRLAASVVLLGVIARSIDRLAEVDGESRAAKATRMLLWAFATVVVVEGAPRRGRAADADGHAAALAALAVAGVRSRGGGPAPAAAAGTLGAGGQPVRAAGRRLRVPAWPGLHKTTFLYDTLSYHLHVPATWMHDRRITIVPAVFGDPSPAYAPANLELWFLFLMAPLRSDYLAGVGQLPFAALAAARSPTAVRDAGGYRAPLSPARSRSC